MCGISGAVDFSLKPIWVGFEDATSQVKGVTYGKVRCVSPQIYSEGDIPLKF